MQSISEVPPGRGLSCKEASIDGSAKGLIGVSRGLKDGQYLVLFYAVLEMISGRNMRRREVKSVPRYL